MTRVGLTLISVNAEGKSDTIYLEIESLLSAVRIMNTYKPKRGYRLVKTVFEEVEALV